MLSLILAIGGVIVLAAGCDDLVGHPVGALIELVVGAALLVGALAERPRR